MEVIIFGAGVTGQYALQFLGWCRVTCFADNKQAGTCVAGKDVISYEEMLIRSKEGKCIVVIASEKYYEEMEKQFIADGGGKYFVFREQHMYTIQNRYPGYNLYKKWITIPYTKILANLKIYQYKKIAIYGDNECLPYLLLDLYEINPKAEVLIAKKNTEENKQNNTLQLNSISLDFDNMDIDCLLINVKLQDSDIHTVLRKEEQKIKFDILDIYEAEDFEPEFLHPELEEYKDKYKGKRVWIVGTAPSLTVDDLNTLHQHKEFCMSVNKVYRVYDKTDWRADILFLGDPRMTTYYMDDISQAPGEIFSWDHYHFNPDCHFTNEIKFVHRKEREYLPNVPKFSTDIATKGVHRAHTSVYALLQMAVYMGFKEIYILGVDNYYAGIYSDVQNHFIENYIEAKEKAIYEGLEFQSGDELCYKSAKQYADTHGIKIYNATRGGTLEVFERVDFDEMFADIKTEERQG